MSMATNDDDVFRPTDEASIALLRGLRAGTVDSSFIHRVDVCSAVPEELVADLQPVPGTDVAEDGYKSVWYFYCPKRYKNTRGEPSGHRQRAVDPDGVKTCWHSEGGPKPVKGVPGATLCSCSYGRMEMKQGPSGRKRFDRMGWNMTEFDDTQGGGGDHVLCRVHRSTSSLAKKKFKSSSSSPKRKAAGDHPEAPPTKMIHDEQVQVQQNHAAFFTNAYPTMPCYGYGPRPQGVDPVTTMPCYGYEPRPEHVQQQPLDEPECGGGFYLDELFDSDEQMQMQMQVQQDPAAIFTNGYPTMPACYGHGGPQGVFPLNVSDHRGVHGGDMVKFNVQDLLKTDEWKDLEDLLAQGEQGQQQPCAEPAEQGCEFVVPVSGHGHVSVC